MGKNQKNQTHIPTPAEFDQQDAIDSQQDATEFVASIGEHITESMSESDLADLAQTMAPFGAPTFSLPDRAVEGRGSKLVADVTVPINGLALDIVTGVWLRETEKDGALEQQFSVSLPRQLRQRKDDPISAETVAAFRGMVITAFDRWSSDPAIASRLGKVSAQPKGAGRLTRLVPKAATKPADTAVVSTHQQ